MNRARIREFFGHRHLKLRVCLIGGVILVYDVWEWWCQR